MKKVVMILALCLVALQLCSSAMAEDGIFVPSFQHVMDSFYGQVKQINEHYAIDIWESCNKDGTWVEDECIYLGFPKPELEVDEGYGFLYTLRIEYDKECFAQNEEEFKAILYAAIKSVLPEDYQLTADEFFERILYQYVIDSPADSLSVYKNFGVYQVWFSKSSGRVFANIQLSLYEHN